MGLTTTTVLKVLAAVGVAAALGAGVEEVPPPEPATSSQFEPGQVWRYQTRPGEEGSRVIIGKIERAPELGTIVHVKLVGLRLRNPAAPGGFSGVLAHAPVSEVQVSASVAELTDEPADLEGFSEGYQTWLSAYRAGDAGIFTISLAEIAEVTEQALSR